MQIDILSSNTLKLTLSRLDMFDLDIKYESLSGKNPETKRLLAHVLKKIRLDKLNNAEQSQKLGFDFTCERIFVEAFPRPDGGCMLYVSSLETEGGKKKRAVAKPRESNVINPYIEQRESQKNVIIFETDSVKELGGVCKSLQFQKERLNIETTLYKSLPGAEGAREKYRLLIKTESLKNSLITSVIREYGEALRGEKELFFTREYFNEIISENAAEKMAELF